MSDVGNHWVDVWFVLFLVLNDREEVAEERNETLVERNVLSPVEPDSVGDTQVTSVQEVEEDE